MVEIMVSTATTLSGGARLGGGLHKRHFGDSAKSRLLRDQPAVGARLGGGRANLRETRSPKPSWINGCTHNISWGRFSNLRVS
jgi:hypothetical protein